MFTFFVFAWKYPFWVNLLRKMESSLKLKLRAYLLLQLKFQIARDASHL